MIKLIEGAVLIRNHPHAVAVELWYSLYTRLSIYQSQGWLGLTLVFSSIPQCDPEGRVRRSSKIIYVYYNVLLVPLSPFEVSKAAKEIQSSSIARLRFATFDSTAVDTFPKRYGSSEEWNTPSAGLRLARDL